MMQIERDVPVPSEIPSSSRSWTDAVRERHGERGAALVLALIFLTLVSMVVISLVSWAGNSLNDTIRFNNTSALEYSTSAAVQVEIQYIRYHYIATVGTFVCTPPTLNASSTAVNGVPVSVYCSIVTNSHATNSRVVTMNSCSTTITQANCLLSPYLFAQVEFDDYASPTNGCTASNQTTCGVSMAIDTWTIV